MTDETDIPPNFVKPEWWDAFWRDAIPSCLSIERRAANLADAIDYAFVVRERGDDGLVWLGDWREGDFEAMHELAEWQRGRDASAVVEF